MSTLSYTAHDEGFLARRKTSPFGIGGAVAVHIGVAAVVLMMPGMPIGNHIPYKRFIITNVPVDKPPPQRTQPTKVEKTVQTRTIDRTDPIVPLRTSTDFTFPPPPPYPTDSGPTQIETPPIPKPPIHNPVLVDARMDPRFANRVQPDYPPGQLRVEAEGKVTVRIRIGTDGRVISIEQVSASHPDFWRATQEQALKAWHFIPATRDGVAVESERVMTVYFKMQN